MSPPTVLFLGATGLIAGPFFAALATSDLKLDITAFVRSSPERAAPLVAQGIKVIHGTSESEDLAKIEELSQQFDLVVDGVDSAKPDVTQAVVKGLQAKGHGQGILIHLSGTGNFANGGQSGKLDPTAKVWDDAIEENIKAIGPPMFNGVGDALVLAAGASGSVQTYVLCAGGIFGPGNLGAYGVFARLFSTNAAQLGFAPYIGDGTAEMQMIHVSDVVSLLLLLIKKALAGPATGSAYSRYYIATGEAVPWKVVAENFGAALHSQGLLPSADAKSVPFEEAGWMAGLIGSTMAVKCSNAAALGWKPTGPKFAGSLAQDLQGFKI